MGIISQILGTGDIIKEGFQLIDDLHTSDEEAIAAKAKAKTDLLNSYAPFKLAQRYLALMFAFTFLLCFALVLSMTMTGQADIGQVKDVIDEFWIGEIMFTIIGFYFGGGFIEGGINQWKKKTGDD